MTRAILIIDDEETLARNLAVYLQRLGHEVRACGSAEEGLAAYAEFKPDVVLLDHNLPGLSGLDALAHLRRLDPAACVVLMTGHGGVELAVSAMKLGAADYLSKPLALSGVKLLIERLLDRSRLETQVRYFQDRQAEGSGLDKIIGRSPAMVALRETIARLLDTESRVADGEAPTVLILGETGSGKELVARALHFGAARRGGPFVELNCGALPAQLIEAELFGHERGAFTDARERKLGLVETADKGTLFLDEIGEAEPSTQVRLLKLLEDKRFRRLGSTREQQVNVRIVSATHRSLEERVKAGQFRADLFYRLRVVEIKVPPLRERGADIVLLATHFLNTQAQRYRRGAMTLAPDAEQALLRHGWPGNVRELRNVMEQVALMAAGPNISARELSLLDLGAPAQPAGGAAVPLVDEDLDLERNERRLIQTALQRTDGNVTRAARLLGVSRDTLRYRLERLGLQAS
jgi:two-component system, NtrC family, response regulator AtoC